MPKRHTKFPASQNLHDGIYLDRTLREFEARKLHDPDRGTKHEGTILELPPLGDGILSAPKRTTTTSQLAVTSVSERTAIDPQCKQIQKAKRWFHALPKRVQAEYASKYGFKLATP